MLAGAARYAFSNAQEEEEKKEKPRVRPTVESSSSRNSMSPYRLENQSFRNFPDDDTVIIGVDATEGRAGGILVLPNTRTIYFYSIDWSDVFQFPPGSQPDKFELTNVLLSLEIFKEYVQEYRWDSDAECSLDLKTDNSIGSIANPSHAYRGGANAQYRKFYLEIDAKLKSRQFYGNWKPVSRRDRHIKMADRLSKVDHSCSKKLPDDLDIPDSFAEYDAINISKTDGADAALHTVAMQVPEQLLKRK